MYKPATNLSVQKSTERPYEKHVQASNKLVSAEEYREAMCKACTSKQQTCKCRETATSSHDMWTKQKPPNNSISKPQVRHQKQNREARNRQDKGHRSEDFVTCLFCAWNHGTLATSSSLSIVCCSLLAHDPNYTKLCPLPFYFPHNFSSKRTHRHSKRQLNLPHTTDIYN